MTRLLRNLLTGWLSRRLPPSSRVRLGQRHIFIVPSAAGYGFALCLLLILLVAINYQNSLAYAMVFLLASIGLLSILHTWRNLAGLELVAQAAEPCFAGQQARVVVQLRSARRAHQAIWLGTGRQQQGAVVASVAAGGQATVKIALLQQVRGQHQVPRLRVSSCYPLGLWNAWSLVDLAQQVLVYPKPLPARLAMGSADSEQAAEGLLAAGRGVDDYEGLAGWQPGESLARINWKIWSKGQGLWVKQFSELQGQQTMLDFNALAGDVELRLSMLCAQVLELSAGDVAFALSLPGQQIAPGQGLAHQHECLRALALFAGGRNV